MRLTRLVPVPLVLTALLPAQFTGVAAALVRPFALDHRYDHARFAVDRFTSVSAVVQPGHDYLAFGYQVGGAAPRIGAARRDRGNNLVTSLTDFNSVTLPGDHWVALHGTEVAVIGNGQNYALALRPNGIGAYGQRRAISGLPAGFANPVPYRGSGGALMIAGCTPTMVWTFELNLLGFVTNGVGFAPALGVPGEVLDQVLPLTDPAAPTVHNGYLVLAHDPANAQRLLHVASPDFSEPLRPLASTPTKNTIRSLTQLRGGTMLATVGGAPGSVFPDDSEVTFASLITGDDSFPAAGGTRLLGMSLPERVLNAQEAVALMAAGFLGARAVQALPFTNPLGLDPATLLVLGLGAIPNYVDTAQFTVQVPAGIPPGTRVAIQGGYVHDIFAEFWLSNTAVFKRQ